MLGGYTELVAHRRCARIALLHESGLGDHLSCITKKFLPLRGQKNALVSPLENGNTKFVLQFPDCRSQARLGNVEPLRSFADAPRLSGLHDVF